MSSWKKRWRITNLSVSVKQFSILPDTTWVELRTINLQWMWMYLLIGHGVSFLSYSHLIKVISNWSSVRAESVSVPAIWVTQCWLHELVTVHYFCNGYKEDVEFDAKDRAILMFCLQLTSLSVSKLIGHYMLLLKISKLVSCQEMDTCIHIELFIQKTSCTTCGLTEPPVVKKDW